MKLLLTGATGFIGTEVLEQCLKHNYIEHIYCLTRKTLDRQYATHRKVTQIIHSDFAEYPDYLLAKLANYGIEACIWCLGGTYRSFKKKEDAERVSIHYPIQAAEAFAKALAIKLDPDAPPNKQKFPFRFIFMSAWGAEQNQFRTLWVWSDSRKIKGAAEKGLFDVADQSQEMGGKKCFEVIALRLGGVIRKGDAISTLVSEAVAPYIAVDRVAMMAIKVSLEGTSKPGQRVLENKEVLGDDWAMVNSLNY